jgi:hypothetical protein
VTRLAASPVFGAELQPFLYGLIGDDKSGTLLSVLSALARQDLDPWEQAGNWSRMPKQAAARELADLIAALPEGLSARPAPAAIADRLVALLPPQSPRPRTAWQPRPLPAQDSAPTDRPAHDKVPLVVFYVLFLLLGQLIISGWQAGRAHETPGPTSGGAGIAAAVPAADGATAPER